jgi:hypothetical protein
MARSVSSRTVAKFFLHMRPSGCRILPVRLTSPARRPVNRTVRYITTPARRYKINCTEHRARLLTRTKALFPSLHRLIACHYGPFVLAPCARRLHRPLASNRKSRAAVQRQGLGMAKRATRATLITYLHRYRSHHRKPPCHNYSTPCDRVKISRSDGYRPLKLSSVCDCIVEEDGESSRHDHSRE